MLFLKKANGETIIRKFFYEKFFSFRPSSTDFLERIGYFKFPTQNSPHDELGWLNETFH